MRSRGNDGELCYGCLKCRSGSERRVIGEIRLRLPGVVAAVALRRAVAHDDRSETLFPGYVCFSAPGDFDIRNLYKIRGVKEILFNPDGTWMLQDEDRERAARLLSEERPRPK